MLNGKCLTNFNMSREGKVDVSGGRIIELELAGRRLTGGAEEI